MLSAYPWTDLVNLPFSHANWELPGGLTAARSGISVDYGDGEIKAVGSACSIDSCSAVYRSKCEALERLALFFTRELDAAREVHGYTLDGRPKSTALITDILPLPSNNMQTDATGLSIQESRQIANKHAYFELVERALLGEFWYGNGFNLPCTEIVHYGAVRVSIRVAPVFEAWFCVSEAYDPVNQIHTTGAAIRSDMESARNHALSEAMMVYASRKREERPIFHTQNSSHNRWESLKGPLSRARHLHFNRKMKNIDVSDCGNIQSLEEEVTIYPLIEGPDWCFVRAVSGNTLLISGSRRETVVMDSFV